MKSLRSSIQIKSINEQRVDKLFILRDIGKGEYFQDLEYPTIQEKIRFISDWCDLSKEEVKEMTVETINKIASTVLQVISDFKPKPVPTKELTINGNKYTFVGRFSEMSASWHELVRMSDFEENPIRMASLCYIEKGMDYATKGKNDTIKNPTSKRDELFTVHFPLDEYLTLNAFFLQKFKEWHESFTEIKRVRNSMKTTPQQ